MAIRIPPSRSASRETWPKRCAKVQFDALPGATHVTITSDPDYAPGMARFIGSLPMP
jgi:hypothetical protein